jgi:hypothetical protein
MLTKNYIILIVFFILFLLLILYIKYINKNKIPSKSLSTPKPSYRPSPLPSSIPKPSYRPTAKPYIPETEKDCIYTEWKNIGECSAPCGGGYQGQVRSGTTPHDDVELCKDISRNVPCNTDPCPSSITPTSQKATDRLYTKWINYYYYTLVFNSDNTVVFNSTKNGVISNILPDNVYQVSYDDNTVINYKFYLADEDTYNDVLVDLNNGYELVSTTGFYYNK